MFRIEIENQNKKTVFIIELVGTIEDAMKSAEEHRDMALCAFKGEATAYIWNLTTGGIDETLDADGWDLQNPE